MQRQLTNHDIELSTWLGFTREELKMIARKHGIGIADRKEELARNLMLGRSASQKEAKTFRVKVSV